MDQENKQQANYMLPASILVAGIMISASIFYLVGSKNSPTGVAQIPGGDQLAAVGGGPSEVGARDAILGDPNAPVTLIEYGDFKCPFCARFHEQVNHRLREEYIESGAVKMVFRNFQFLGPESLAAGEASECAKDQGAFWAFHDAIYDEEIRLNHSRDILNRDFFVRTAQSLGLNVGEFSSCIDSGKYAAQIEADRNAAAAAGVNSTPTTFINGRKLQGALPYEQFRAAIEEELAKK